MASVHKKVIVIHEYGEPSHYSGLSQWCNKNQVDIEFRSFNVLKRIYLLLRKKKKDSLNAIFSDFIWFIIVCLYPGFLKNKLCVIGMAPFDIAVVPMLRILKACKFIYHTSWLYWDGVDVPKKSFFFSNLVKNKWQTFLVRAQAVAAVTPDVKDNLNRHYPVTAGKTEVVYHSFDPDVFNADNRTADEKIRVTFLGRLEEYKGMESLVSLAQQLPDVHFNIIGAGAKREYIINCSKELDNLNFFGFIKEKELIANALKKSDIIILPSQKIPGWEELFGMALIEAMACGCIPIAVDHRGPLTILKSTGLSENILPESEFVQQAFNKINYLKSHLPIICEQKEQSKLIAEKYTINSISNIWDKIIYNRMVK